jgi:hypothetical protein
VTRACAAAARAAAAAFLAACSAALFFAACRWAIAARVWIRRSRCCTKTSLLSWLAAAAIGWASWSVTIRRGMRAACPCGSWAWGDQVAAVAEAAVATDSAPAAAMTTALDRLSPAFLCRDKGTFR